MMEVLSCQLQLISTILPADTDPTSAPTGRSPSRPGRRGSGNGWGTLACLRQGSSSVESTTTGYQYVNLNHQQWNPVIPDLLLYAHEGTWHEVDRTWNIHADGSGMKLMHKQTMDMEINGHEWWSFNGKTVWFDLQTPRSEDFWIAGVNIDTMKETRYHINRDTCGAHFNGSRDDTMFMSDGGDASQVSYSPNGK